MTYIIDAYNVIKKWETYKNKKIDIFSFLNTVSKFSDYSQEKIIVVFDGKNKNEDLIQSKYTNIQIIFSGIKSTADSVIEKLITEKNDKKIKLITSDKAEYESGLAENCIIISPAQFYDITKNLMQESNKINTKAEKINKKKWFTLSEIIDKEILKKLDDNYENENKKTN